ncbi:hypothetical protein SMICM304S_09217 [Streptomyces microflavus]
MDERATEAALSLQGRLSTPVPAARLEPERLRIASASMAGRGCGFAFCRTAAVCLAEAMDFSGGLTFLNFSQPISPSSAAEDEAAPEPYEKSLSGLSPPRTRTAAGW